MYTQYLTHPASVLDFCWHYNINVLLLDLKVWVPWFSRHTNFNPISKFLKLNFHCCHRRPQHSWEKAKQMMMLTLNLRILNQVLNISSIWRGELPTVCGAHSPRRVGSRTQRGTGELQQSQEDGNCFSFSSFMTILLTFISYENTFWEWQLVDSHLFSCCGLFGRDTAVPELKGHKKEHGWVLVSKSLTLGRGKSFDDFPSEKNKR